MKKIEDKIIDLLDVTARLSKLLKQENAILATNARANRIKPFQKEKIALSYAYEQQLQTIGNEEDLKDIDPSMAKRLRDAVTSFGLLLEENATRLKAKIDAGEHLFRIISESAIDHQDKTAGYGSSGATVDNKRQAYRPAVSVGLNQEL
ncbi:MAG: hypothetical protein VX693_06700 [Pseudomonadota bacterium]|nr:hypothetical protein [Pseudomonadota bacterium]